MTELALPCFVAEPRAPTGRGVVVIHEGMGINTHVLRFAEALAAEGYTAVAPDWFFRTGGPKEYEDFWVAINAITPEQCHADLASAIAELRRRGATSVGVTGFCMGGNFSYAAAKWADELGVDAAVGFYGGRIAEELGDPKCPTLLLFAGDDEFVPPDAIAAVQARHGDMVVVYPDAHHSFMRDDGPTYHPDAAADAWSRLLAFFGEHLS